MQFNSINFIEFKPYRNADAQSAVQWVRDYSDVLWLVLFLLALAWIMAAVRKWKGPPTT
jgi:hypothetical protein